MKLLGATGSHVGNVREANQDRVYFRSPVAALADGMGGHQGGERAAELAIERFEEAGPALSEGDLVEVVLQANRQVHGHANDNGLPGMGTTVVALTLHDDDTITVANVGDSRAYWLRGDYMGQVTEDHSFVEDLVRQGRLTPQEAAIHPQRNILTRAVGIGPEVEVDRFPIPEPEVGDRFLLCSDGLFNELSEEDILEIMLESGDPEDTAIALIEATLRTPCRDNVTVAVVEVVADDDPRVADQEGGEAAGRGAADDGGRDTESKVITAPIPVVSQAVLHESGVDEDEADAVAGGRSPDGEPVGSAGDTDAGDSAGDGADGLRDVSDGGASSTAADDPSDSDEGGRGDRRRVDATKTLDLGMRGRGLPRTDGGARAGTLLLDEQDTGAGGAAELDDPELLLDTVELEVMEGAAPLQVRPRSRLLPTLAAIVLLAVAAGGGFFWARSFAASGFFIGESTAGRLAIFEGRRGGFLFFDPVTLAETEVQVDTLDASERVMVEGDFDSRAEAEAVIEEIEVRHAEAEAKALAEASGDTSSAPSDSSQAETSDTDDSSDLQSSSDGDGESTGG